MDSESPSRIDSGKGFLRCDQITIIQQSPQYRKARGAAVFEYVSAFGAFLINPNRTRRFQHLNSSTAVRKHVGLAACLAVALDHRIHFCAMKVLS